MVYKVNAFTSKPDQVGTGGGGGGTNFVWQADSSTSISASVNMGYICESASLTTVTLPSTAAVGNMLEVVADSTGGFKLTYGAGQLIKFGLMSTTTSSGYIQSTEQGDSLRLVCTTANTTWRVVSSVGNFNLV